VEKRRAGIDARKLAVVTRMAAALSAKAGERANAKAKAVVEKAAALAKAGTEWRLTGLASKLQG